MSELAAVVGIVHMRRMRQVIERRRTVAARYDEALARQGFLRPLAAPTDCVSNYYKYIAMLVLASTVWVYGATAGRGERTEDAPVDLARAGHLYVSTKLAAETLMHSYREMYGLEFSILRYGIPYGPRMRDALVVARFVRAAQLGEPITIAGTGDQQCNFLYVEDLAGAHTRALGPAAANQTLALEGDTTVSVNEIAETVQHLVRPVPVRRVPGRAADYEGVAISNRLAKEVLSWSPSTSFPDGARRYLAWLERGGGEP